MGPNAINDILESSRFEGAMKNIRWLTEVVDQGFITFISVIAFFIISAALLRNVVAGAYAAFPKFWDTIADAKESMKGKQLNLGGQDVSFLAKVGAFLIPNLKAMSDFSDDTIEPKHYFIKAIPQMVMVVLIGITIYNGYYRDIVAKTAGFGTEILTRTILKVDPGLVLDKMFTALTRPDFVSATDTSSMGKYTNTIATSAYDKVVNKYTDIEDIGTKSKIAQSIENNVYSFLQSKDRGFFDSEKYRMTYTVDLVLGEPELRHIEAENGNHPTLTSYGLAISTASLGFDSHQYVGEPWYLRIKITFDKQVEKVKDTGIYQDLILTVSDNQIITNQSNGAVVSLTVNSSTDFYSSGGNVYTYDSTTGVLKFNNAVNADSGVIALSPWLTYTTSDGKQHAVTEIHIVTGTANFAQSLKSKSRPNITTPVGGDFSIPSE